VPHDRNGKGQSILHPAIEAHNLEIVQLLSQEEGIRGMKSHLGETALHTALRVLFQTGQSLEILSPSWMLAHI
jgi:hypothetical protein